MGHYTPYEIGLLRSMGYLPKILSGPAWSLLSDTTSPTRTLMVNYLLGLVTFELVRMSLERDWSFTAFACIRLVRSATNAVSPLTDAVILQITSAHQKEEVNSPESYGRQRVFSSLAWGVGSVGVGKLIDVYGTDIIFNYTRVSMLVSMLLTYAIARQLDEESRRQLAAKGKEKPKAKPNPISAIVALVRQHPGIRRFAAQVSLLGFVMTISDTVVPVHIEFLEGSRSFSGATTLVAILGGVPFFWYSRSIYQTKGIWFMLRLATYFLIVRMLVLSLVNSQDRFWLLMLCQPLHGMTFSLVLTGSIEYLTSFSSDMNSTSSSAVNTLFFTIGHGLGSVFWMQVLEMNGNVSNNLYLVGAALMIADVLAGGVKEDIQRELQRNEDSAEGGEGEVLLKVV
jgi:hypothetical protein